MSAKVEEGAQAVPVGLPEAREKRRISILGATGSIGTNTLAVISEHPEDFEVEAVTDDYVYADRIFGELAWWLRTAPFLPVLLALGFATGFAHYALDRATFRFSSPEVRQAGRGLLQPARRFE